jgi:hypothetical protein
VSQRKECVSEIFFEFRGECARWAHQNIHKTQRGASRLLNTLEEEVCAEKAHKIELLNTL